MLKARFGLLPLVGPSPESAAQDSGARLIAGVASIQVADMPQLVGA
jgi:hypothetical protein